MADTPTRNNHIKREPAAVIVEDDEQISEILRETLQRHKFKVITLSTASFEEFMALCPDAPDVLVCDLNLPGGNGEDLCRAILKTYPQCKVIYMTGSLNTRETELPAEFKPLRLLQKPFALSTFMTAVTEVAGGS